MTVVAVMSTDEGTPRLDAIVRPGVRGVDIDGSDKTRDFLLGLLVTAGDPPEPLTDTDGDDWIQALPWALTGTHVWAEYVSSGQRGEPIRPTDFDHRLELFEADLTRHALQVTAVGTYVSHAKRFVKWAQAVDAVAYRTPTELLSAYQLEVDGRGLAPHTVQSYRQYASMFVRWLLETYRPGERRTSDAAETDEDDTWLSEQETQARLVRWLQNVGWTIREQSVGHQHGVDVIAEHDGTIMGIEVKGHPQDRLIAGQNKGQARVFHPAAQARTYFANALHAALTMADRQPSHLTAIALPDRDRYRSMAVAVRGPLEQLGIGVYLVPRSGTVMTFIRPHAGGKEGP